MKHSIKKTHFNKQLDNKLYWKLYNQLDNQLDNQLYWQLVNPLDNQLVNKLYWKLRGQK